jgi:DNA-binding NtrC family response regulator
MSQRVYRWEASAFPNLKTILVIEDEDGVRMLVRTVLSRAGYRILTASSTAEAQQLWQSEKDQVALVISDNSLPDGSGIELVLRFEREKPEIKVIVASGLVHHDLPWRFYQLAKPFNAQFLLAFVKGALEGSEPKT